MRAYLHGESLRASAVLFCINQMPGPVVAVWGYAEDGRPLWLRLFHDVRRAINCRDGLKAAGVICLKDIRGQLINPETLRSFLNGEI